MKKLHRSFALVLAVLLVLCLSACGQKEEGYTLTVSLPDELTTLDPAMVTTRTEKTVVNHLYANLMKLTDNGEGGVQVDYDVASSYRCETNLDGTQTYTFTLRNDAVWSDGQSVTAEDFVLSWRRLVDPATASPNAAILDMVAGYTEARKSGDMTKLQISASDERTLVVVLSHSCLNFPQMVCASAVTMPVRLDQTETENWSLSAQTLIANGPYCHVVSWEGSTLTVQSGEDYYGYRRLGPVGISFTFGAEAENADFVLHTQPSGESKAEQQGTLPYTGTLVINQMSALSSELRQAMSLTIDRQQIAQLLGSAYIPADGLIPGGVHNTQGTDFRALAGALIDNDSEGLESRRESARELLDGLALPENVTLLYVSDGVTDTVAQMLRNTWRECLGLEITIQAKVEEEFDSLLHKGEFTIALVMTECTWDDASAILNDWTSGAADNYAHIHDSAYDLLMRIAQSSSSAEARDAYLMDAERLLLESGYVVPVCSMVDAWELNDDLTGVYADGLGQYFFRTVTRKTA